jgi:hypothetical protein
VLKRVHAILTGGRRAPFFPLRSILAAVAAVASASTSCSCRVLLLGDADDGIFGRMRIMRACCFICYYYIMMIVVDAFHVNSGV